MKRGFLRELAEDTQSQLDALNDRPAPAAITPEPAPAREPVPPPALAVVPPPSPAKPRAAKSAVTNGKDGLTGWERQRQERATEKAHIGAWLPKGFKRGIKRVLAETDEDAQTFFARLLNAEFKARKVPIVEL
jgi:hypothetical protein